MSQPQSVYAAQSVSVLSISSSATSSSSNYNNMHQSQSTSSVATNSAASIQALPVTVPHANSTTLTSSSSAEQKNPAFATLETYYEQREYSAAYELTQILLQCSKRNELSTQQLELILEKLPSAITYLLVNNELGFNHAERCFIEYVIEILPKMPYPLQCKFYGCYADAYLRYNIRDWTSQNYDEQHKKYNSAVEYYNAGLKLAQENNDSKAEAIFIASLNRLQAAMALHYRLISLTRVTANTTVVENNFSTSGELKIDTKAEQARIENARDTIDKLSFDLHENYIKDALIEIDILTSLGQDNERKETIDQAYKLLEPLFTKYLDKLTVKLSKTVNSTSQQNWQEFKTIANGVRDYFVPYWAKHGHGQNHLAKELASLVVQCSTKPIRAQQNDDKISETKNTEFNSSDYTGQLYGLCNSYAGANHVSQDHEKAKDNLLTTYNAARKELLAIRGKHFAAFATKEVDILARQYNYSQDIVSFLSNFIATIIVILGDGPGDFSVFAMGSLARGEMTLDSDLDLAIFVADDSYAQDPFFNNFIRLLNLQIRCLGSQKLQLDSGEITHMQHGKFIMTPKGLIEDNELSALYLINHLTAEAKNDGAVPPYSTLCVAPIFSYSKTNPSGNFLANFLNNYEVSTLIQDYVRPNLTLQYQELLAKALDSQSSKKIANYYGEKHAKQYFSILRQQQKAQDNKIDLKALYLAPIKFWCLDMALFYGIFADAFYPVTPKQSLVMQCLDLMQEKKLLPADFVKEIKSKLSYVTTLRMENNKVLENPKTEILQKLKDIENHLLIPMYQALKRLIKHAIPTTANFHPILFNWEQLQKAFFEVDPSEDTRSYPKIIGFEPEEIQLILSTVVYYTVGNNLQKITKVTQDSKEIKTEDLIQLKNTSPYKEHYSHIPHAYRRDYLKYLAEALNYYQVEQTTSIALIEELEFYPDIAGNRLAYEKTQSSWYLTLQNSLREIKPALASDSKETKATSVPEQKIAAEQLPDVYIATFDLTSPNTNSIKYYHPDQDFIASLFKPKTQEFLDKSKKQGGRHLVLPIKHGGDIPFYFKLFPEQPAIEYMIWHLSWRLGDRGVPCNLPIKLVIRKKDKNNIVHEQSYPALLIENAENVIAEKVLNQEILTLEDTLKQHPERLEHILKTSFTTTLLRILLTNPEDDKGDDYFLIPIVDKESKATKYHLVRIDNERAYYKADEDTGMIFASRTLNVKSIIYCLDQMLQIDQFDQQSLSEFLRLDSLSLLKSVFHDLDCIHKKFLQLYGEKEIISNATSIDEKNNKPGPTFLAFMLAVELPQILLERLSALQNCITIMRNQNGGEYKAIQALRLLEATQSNLAKYYRAIFKQYQVDPKRPELAKQRFDKVTKGLYQIDICGHRCSIMPSIKAMRLTTNLKSELIAKNLADFLGGQQQAEIFKVLQPPHFALQALQQVNNVPIVSLQHNLVATDAKLRGEANIAFQNLKFNRLKYEVFKGIVKNDIAEKDLAIQQFVLETIVGTIFTSLDLSPFYKVLTDALLENILAKTGEFLLSLTLSNCENLSNNAVIAIEKYCSNLEYLRLSNIHNDIAVSAFSLSSNYKLISIDANFPMLRSLDLSGCKELKKITLEAPNLYFNDLNLTGCLALESGRLNDIKIAAPDTNTDILAAAKLGSIMPIAWLTIHGADLNTKDSNGDTALTLAAWTGHTKLVAWLIKHGAKTTDKDKYGNTALLLAANEGQQDTIEWLLDNKQASLDEKNNKGNTALLLAAQGGHQDTVKWLLDNKQASIGEKNYFNDTALILAARNGHTKLVLWLIKCVVAPTGKYDTDLLKAAQSGHQDAVEWLLDNKQASIDEKNNNDDTALTLAARNGHTELVSWLISRGAKVTDKNKFGNTALLTAAIGCHQDTIEWLLSNGHASLDEKNSNDNTALTLAAGNGHTKLVAWLISRGAKVTDKNKFGNTALLKAAIGGQQDTIEWLLDNKQATLDEKNSNDDTALALGAWNGHTKLIAWLISRGSKVTDKDKNGNTALLAAAYGGYQDTIKWLLDRNLATLDEKNSNDDTAVIVAAFNGHTKLVVWLISRGAKVTDKNKDGNTALLSAAAGGHQETIEWLLDSKNASLDERNNNDDTALTLAALKGHTKLVVWLISCGAKVTDKNKDGNTALLTAAQGGQQNTIKWLLGKTQATLDEQNNNDDTALTLAALNGHTKLVAWLISHGAEETDKNKDGNTALLLAAQGGHQDTVELLLDNTTATLDTENNNDDTALTLAARNGHTKLVAWLISRGAKATDKDKCGNTALLSAAISGHQDTIKWLLDNTTATLDQKNNNDDTALTLAAWKGHTKLVAWLISRGAEVTDRDKYYGNTALLKAAIGGHQDTIEWFLDNKQASLNEKNINYDTALTLAALNGHTKLLAWLIKRGANVTDKNKDGNTALLFAARGGQQDTIKWLLDRNLATLDEKNNYNDTALTLASSLNGHTKLVEWLIKYIFESTGKNTYDTALLWAALGGYQGRIERFLDNKQASLHRKNSNDDTALTLAAQNGDTKLFEWLISRGANDDTVLTLAARNAHTKLVNWLIKCAFESTGKNTYGTALNLAAQSGDTKLVAWLISRGAKVTDKDEYGNTVLFSAVLGDHQDTIEWLLDNKKVSIDEKDQYGNTALTLAARRGHTKLVTSLISRGAKVTDKDEYGNTVLFSAVLGDHQDTIEWLLDSKQASLDEKYNNDDTALTLAAWKGHTKLVAWLISRGAKATDRDKYGNTALLSAAQCGHQDVIEWLLDNKQASLDEKNNYDDTALILAAGKGNTKLVVWLISRGAKATDRDKYGNTALLSAAQCGHQDVIEWLLDNKQASLDEKNNYDDTALIWAAYMGRTKLVAWLISRGAKATERDKYGNDALLSAAVGGHQDTIEWLLDNKKASFDEKNNYDNTAFILAAQNGHTKLVAWLISCGAKATERDKYGNDALLSAAVGGHQDTIEWLLDNKQANLDEKDNYDNTALSFAALNGHTALVAWLLTKNQAMLNARNYNGDTALLMASYNNQMITIEWLLNHGAGLNEKNKLNQTAFDLAGRWQDLYFITIADNTNFPDLSARPITNLPILVKKSSEIYVYGIKEDATLGYTKLDASKFEDIAFPAIGAAETKLDKDEYGRISYDEIIRKKGHLPQQQHRTESLEFLENWQKSLQEHRSPPTLSLAIYLQAAEQEPYAQYSAGCCYEQENNLEQAIVWYQKAANKYAEAHAALDRLQKIPLKQLLEVKEEKATTATTTQSSIGAQLTRQELTSNSATTTATQSQESSSSSNQAKEPTAKELKEFAEKLAAFIKSLSQQNIDYDQLIDQKPWEAKLGGATIYFDEYKALGDGDCGFHVLGTSREILVNLLLEEKSNNTYRELLAPEIREFFAANANANANAAPQLFAQSLANLNTIEEKLNSGLSNAKLECKYSKAWPLELTTLATRVDWLLNQPEIQNLSFKTAIKDLSSNWSAENKKIDTYCQSEQAYEQYLKLYITKKLWLGYKSALLYARKKQINLYIWHSDPENVGKLQLKDNNKCIIDSPAIIHMLHTNRFTHFNLLVIREGYKPLSNNQMTFFNPQRSEDMQDTKPTNAIDFTAKS